MEHILTLLVQEPSEAILAQLEPHMDLLGFSSVENLSQVYQTEQRLELVRRISFALLLSKGMPPEKHTHIWDLLEGRDHLHLAEVFGSSVRTWKVYLDDSLVASLQGCLRPSEGCPSLFLLKVDWEEAKRDLTFPAPDFERSRRYYGFPGSPSSFICQYVRKISYIPAAFEARHKRVRLSNSPASEPLFGSLDDDGIRKLWIESAFAFGNTTQVSYLIRESSLELTPLFLTAVRRALHCDRLDLFEVCVQHISDRKQLEDVLEYVKTELAPEPYLKVLHQSRFWRS